MDFNLLIPIAFKYTYQPPHFLLYPPLWVAFFRLYYSKSTTTIV